MRWLLEMDHCNTVSNEQARYELKARFTFKISEIHS